ncbi:MAG: ParA family protein [Candidatus Woesearchaeota archaeon]
MKKICVINQKGGVGKTTVVVNLAAGLARAGKKVLLIDLDPHASLRSCLPVREELKNIYHILLENVDPNECIHKVAINLDLIASDEHLAEAEMALVNESAREYVLAKKLRSIKKYDYVIIDCPPSLGLLSQNAMIYSQEVFVTAATDVLGVIATKKMTKTVSYINDMFTHDLQITKIIPTMYDKRNKICKESLAEIQNHFYERVTNPIHVNSKLKEAAKRKCSIFAFAPKNRASDDFRELVRNVLYDESDVDTSVSVDIKEGKRVSVASK